MPEHMGVKINPHILCNLPNALTCCLRVDERTVFLADNQRIGVVLLPAFQSVCQDSRNGDGVPGCLCLELWTDFKVWHPPARIMQLLSDSNDPLVQVYVFPSDGTYLCKTQSGFVLDSGNLGGLDILACDSLLFFHCF